MHWFIVCQSSQLHKRSHLHKGEIHQGSDCSLTSLGLLCAQAHYRGIPLMVTASPTLHKGHTRTKGQDAVMLRTGDTSSSTQRRLTLHRASFFRGFLASCSMWAILGTWDGLWAKFLRNEAALWLRPSPTRGIQRPRVEKCFLGPFKWMVKAFRQCHHLWAYC